MFFLDILNVLFNMNNIEQQLSAIPLSLGYLRRYLLSNHEIAFLSTLLYL